MGIVADISQRLKGAREAKGLSQRALAKLAGMPQSHISKIENVGVDLRISSLVEVARALDLELTLVPRKSVPAVHSIVRNTQPAAPRQVASVAKELTKLQSVVDKIARQQGAFKEAIQLQNRVHDLGRFELPPSSLETIEKLNKQLRSISQEPDSVRAFRRALDRVQSLRNVLAHNPTEQVTKAFRSVYSLEEEHG